MNGRGKKMKKRNIINLIKYFSEKNENGFREEAYEIARFFDKSGDHQLSQYIIGLLSDANTFIPQMNSQEMQFFKKVEIHNESLPLPEAIRENVMGIINAVGHNVGINKFLFEGPPGTGKTQSANQIARILDRELYSVEFNSLIDSKLGQTAKNINTLFDEIKSLVHPEKVVILFDEIDAIAIDRLNPNDLREMGRATSAVLKGLEELNSRIVLIATTNLFQSFDKALIRRFDYVVNFSQYSREDLIEIAEILLNNFLTKFRLAGRNMRLFRKIINLFEPIPYPGELKNLIRSSLAFSSFEDEFDYLKKLYKSATKDKNLSDLQSMYEKGFTMREIEILTGTSKSQIARDLKEN